MGEFFIVLILVSPILLVVGLIKPNLFRKLFGKVPTRMAVAKLSGALFVGSFFGAGMTLEPIDPIKDADSSYTESTPTEETPTVPSLEKTLLEEEEVEKPAPKNEQILPETSTKEVEQPVIETPQQEEYIYTPPVVETTPQEAAPTSPGYICSYNAYNCDDFSSWSEANEVYNYCISVGAGDIHDLDRDNDGACDSLK